MNLERATAQSQMKWAPRIRLRTVFLFVFCAAVGLAIGTRPKGDEAAWLWFYPVNLDWYFAIVASVTVAMIIGLGRQALWMSKLDLQGAVAKPAFSFSKSFAVVWRLAIAGILMLSLGAALLMSRQIVSLPETETLFTYELFPYVVWICAIVVALMSSVSQWRQGYEARTRSPNWIGWLIATLLALLILINGSLITYLVLCQL